MGHYQWREKTVLMPKHVPRRTLLRSNPPAMQYNESVFCVEQFLGNRHIILVINSSLCILCKTNTRPCAEMNPGNSTAVSRQSHKRGVGFFWSRYSGPV